MRVDPLVSICIPTYNRPDQIEEALVSCAAQTYKNIEIVISDDSTNDLTEQKVNDWKERVSFPVRYLHNRPSLYQARNVNQLFDEARGEYLVLLHDDDLIVPDAVENLYKCFVENPQVAASFGKQYLITMSGEPLESDKINEDFYRTKTHAGLQSSPLWSSLVGQFPNDGYMIRTKFARETRYSEEVRVGHACDIEFGFRLAMKNAPFYYLDQFTAKYRVSDVAISQGNYADEIYFVYSAVPLPKELEKTRESYLTKYASPAVNRYIQSGNIPMAREIYFSSLYPKDMRYSAKGVAQFLLLLLPAPLAKMAFKK